MTRMTTDLEKRTEAIEARNARVALDKAWELSWTRRLAISALIYGCAIIFLLLIQAPSPMLSACVPMGGYILSTLTLPALKRFWATVRERG